MIKCGVTFRVKILIFFVSRYKIRLVSCQNSDFRVNILVGFVSKFLAHTWHTWDPCCARTVLQYVLHRLVRERKKKKKKTERRQALPVPFNATHSMTKIARPVSYYWRVAH